MEEGKVKPIIDKVLPLEQVRRVLLPVLRVLNYIRRNMNWGIGKSHSEV